MMVGTLILLLLLSSIVLMVIDINEAIDEAELDELWGDE